MLQLRTAKQSSVTTARCQAKKSSDVAVPPLHESAQGICRRTLFNIVSLSLPLLWPRKAGALEGQRSPVAGTSTLHESSCSDPSRLPKGTCYAQAGPLQPLDLPRLEHICTSCFPSCVGDRCILNIRVTYPKGGSVYGLSPPYPLAVFSGGFTVNSAAYKSTAARLASWGYTVIRYDTRDALPDVLDDITCVRLQRELIDWAATHPLMRRLADTNRVYLTGHSRGGKLAALTAAADSRVAALCLLDPVDVTQYAPLSDRFPSAAAALRQVVQTGRFLPVAVVGSGQSGDCAPRYNNYSSFFQASPSAAWEVYLPDAGHFQYLDQSSVLQRAVCGGGGVTAPDDSAVRHVSQAVMVAWGEAMVKQPGTDIISSLAARCTGVATPTGLTAYSSRQWLAQHDSLQPQVVASIAELAGTPEGSAVADSTATIEGSNSRGQGLSHAHDSIAQQSASRVAGMGGQHNSPKATSSETADAASIQQSAELATAVLPIEQTRQEVWTSSGVASPAQLVSNRTELQQLLVALSYKSAATLSIESRFKNFGP